MFSNEKEVRQEMKKFSEIEYVRPDMEVEKEKIGAYTEALKNVKSYDCLLYTSPSPRDCS